MIGRKATLELRASAVIVACEGRCLTTINERHLG
jgi:hypothetical protein